MTKKRKLALGVLVAALAVSGIVVLAVAQGGMMNRSRAGATSAAATRSAACPMAQATCGSTDEANSACPAVGAGTASANGDAVCARTSGSSGIAGSASCPAAESRIGCPMMRASGGACPMGRGGRG